ncbi:MAG: hypothetical protein LQ340_000887 [Diploschistes diacapsis]|nr:MAG: hypothetical protein LQ340_000887 [Diploschistes diacapsis]
MSEAERLDYTRAALCMYTHASRTDPAAAPRARNRVDDFVYQHINQTSFMHQDGLLLPWHRHYIWSREKDLRETIGANLMQSDSIHTFHRLLEFMAHFQSHQHLGKDGMDTHSTPNDAVFWLLHGQIDRLWSL